MLAGRTGQFLCFHNNSGPASNSCLLLVNAITQSAWCVIEEIVKCSKGIRRPSWPCSWHSHCTTLDYLPTSLGLLTPGIGRRCQHLLAYIDNARTSSIDTLLDVGVGNIIHIGERKLKNLFGKVFSYCYSFCSRA